MSKDATTTLPFLDYGNYEFEFSEKPDFITDIRSKLTASSKNVYNDQDGYGNQLSAPMISDAASQSALLFLSKIDAVLLLELIDDQRMEVWQGDKNIGTYTIRMSRIPADENLLHITTEYCAQESEHRFRTIIDGIVNDKLETVIQKRIQIESGLDYYREYKCSIKLEDSGSYAVDVLNDDNGVITSWNNVYPKSHLSGFVSECAHILLGRLFACDEAVPEQFESIGMDEFGHFGKTTYASVPFKVHVFRPYRVSCFGFRRSFSFGSSLRNPVSIEEYFLNRRLVHREDLQSSIEIKSVSIPDWKISSYLTPNVPRFQPSLSMETDWFMKTRDNEQREHFRSRFSNLTARYPQLTQPLKEVVHLILTYRPDDVFGFISESFRHWKGMFKTEDLENNNDSIPPVIVKNETPHADNTVHQLLRAYGV